MTENIGYNGSISCILFKYRLIRVNPKVNPKVALAIFLQLCCIDV